MRLIDADALWNALNDAGGTGAEHGTWDDGWDKAIDAAIRMLEKAPTVEPKPQWIPVTERLPECGEHYESNDVLVSVDYRPDDPEETKDTFVSIDHVCFNCFEQGEFSIERDNPYDTEPSPYFVTHWLPLPEPYTPEREENA